MACTDTSDGFDRETPDGYPPHNLQNVWLMPRCLLPVVCSFIVVACVRCVVFNARTRALSLLSVSLSLPPLFFSFAIQSLLLSSSPLARLLPSRHFLTCSLPLFFNSCLP